MTGALPQDVNWAALADPLATTVVYMGKRTFAALAAGLVAQGLPPDTPALYAAAVSTPDQRLVRMGLTALARWLEDDASPAPALILYGALAGESP